MHPELLKIGPITIYSYGVFMGIAFIVGSYLAVSEAKRKGMDPEKMFDFIVVMLVVSIVTARLFYVVFRLPDYLQNPLSILDLRDGAGAIHGGLFGGIAVAVYYANRYRVSFWQLADALAPSIAIGMVFGRTGCLLAGCCYGTLSTLPWAVTTQLAPGWRHPAQAYEALLDLALFAFLWFYRSRQRFSGQMFLLYMGLYSVVRFGVEFFREPELPMGPLTFAQWLSVAMAVFAVSMMVRLSRRESAMGQSLD